MIKTKTDLQATFIFGYIPTEQDFTDVFDSFAPLDPATGQIIGDGTQLTNVLKPEDNVSSMTNDAGYITSASIPTNVSSLTNDSNYLTSISGLTADAVSSLSGHNVSELTNDSGFITSGAIPTNVSTLTNDAGYITSALQPNSTADGTYAIYNDGTTSGQLSSITISGGLITGVTTLP